MSIFSEKNDQAFAAFLLVLATSGAALSVGVYVAAPVSNSRAVEMTTFVSPAEVASPEQDAADADQLGSLAASIGTSWDAGQSAAAMAKFQDWFAVAKRLHNRYPSSETLNGWIADMRGAEQDLQLESSVASLQPLALAINDQWQADELTLAMQSLERWLGIAADLHPRDPLDAKALTDWVGQMKSLHTELGQQIAASDLWKALDRGSVDIAASLEGEDTATAQQGFTEWFKTADQLRPLLRSASPETQAAFAQWIAEMKQSASQLESAQSGDATVDDSTSTDDTAQP